MRSNLTWCVIINREAGDRLAVDLFFKIIVKDRAGRGGVKLIVKIERLPLNCESVPSCSKFLMQFYSNSLMWLITLLICLSWNAEDQLN